MDIAPYLKEKNELIERQLKFLLQDKNVLHDELYEAARYSILGGGKRLRPILALATVETLGGNPKNALSAACALEMVHCYSLIHDDLPCMDDDDFRRGKPSLHKAFTEGLAVLAGDFLLTYAFEILSHDPLLAPHQKIDLIKILSKNAGGDGMIAGQVVDLLSVRKDIDIETLQTIHRNKTGALITASIQFGAVVANAPVSHAQILQEFSSDIGLAFQIIDDVLDITSSEAKHGKAVASDVQNGKTTYVSLLGLEPSKTLATSLFESAIKKLRLLPYNTDLLQALAEVIVRRDA